MYFGKLKSLLGTQIIPALIIRKDLDYPNFSGREPLFGTSDFTVISAKSRGKELPPSSDSYLYRKTSLKSLQ